MMISVHLIGTHDSVLNRNNSVVDTNDKCSGYK